MGGEAWRRERRVTVLVCESLETLSLGYIYIMSVKSGLLGCKDGGIGLKINWFMLIDLSISYQYIY